MPAAQALGADLGKSVMAIAYGEQWMNMAQPFWHSLLWPSPDWGTRHHGVLHHRPALLRRHFCYWIDLVLTATSYLKELKNEKLCHRQRGTYRNRQL
jgi:hypothetical protein